MKLLREMAGSPAAVAATRRARHRGWDQRPTFLRTLLCALRPLTLCWDHNYTDRMHPLASIALVLSTALLWAVFVLLMLARVDREGRRALRLERKAVRMKTRPRGQRETAWTRRSPVHYLKVRRRHPSAAQLPISRPGLESPSPSAEGPPEAPTASGHKID